MFGRFRRELQVDLTAPYQLSASDQRLLDSVAPDNKSGVVLPCGIRVTDAQIDEHVRKTEERMNRDHPLIMSFFRMYPQNRSGWDACMLSDLYDQNVPVAQEEIVRELGMQYQTASNDYLQQLVKRRAEEITLHHACTEEEGYLYSDKMFREEQYRQDVLNRLDDIRESVDRSAVAANAIDTIKAHPFLAGFFGTHLFSKLTK